MNKKTIIIILAALVSFTSMIHANTASDKVAVLYEGRTQVNRNALHFMGSEFQRLNTPYRFEAFDNSKDVKPGEYRAILILNTGYKTGMSPALSDFISSWQDKSEIILINIIKGSREITVTTIPAADNPEGVDAVSAASLWKSSGISFLKSNNTDQMHEQWVREVLSLIENKE